MAFRCNSKEIEVPFLRDMLAAGKTENNVIWESRITTSAITNLTSVSSTDNAKDETVNVNLSLRVDQPPQNSTTTNLRTVNASNAQVQSLVPPLQSSSRNHRSSSFPSSKEAWRCIQLTFYCSFFYTFGLLFWSFEFILQMGFFLATPPSSMSASVRTFLTYASCPIGFASGVLWLAVSRCECSRPILPLLHISGLIFGEVVPTVALFTNILYTDNCGYLAVLGDMWNFKLWLLLVLTIYASIFKLIQGPLILGLWNTVLETAFGGKRKATSGWFYFMMALLSVLPICLCGIVGSLVWNPQRVSAATGCTQFQFRIERELGYPLVNISDSNATTWNVIQLKQYQKWTTSETVEGSKFLATNKHQILVKCGDVFAGKPSNMGLVGLNAIENCKLVISISISDRDYQPEFNVMLKVSGASNSPASCMTRNLPYFTFTKPNRKFSVDQVCWKSEELVGNQLRSVCGGGTSSEPFGQCQEDNTTLSTLSSRMVPKVDCFRRCYSWIDHWPEGAFTKEDLRGEMVARGRSVNMRFNFKLGMPCEE